MYGYEDFRNLEVYDDLFRGKEKLQLSQGQLIEEVIMEAEKGIKGDSSAHNLLLTAPTGAGKSLLFQLLLFIWVMNISFLLLWFLR